MLKHPFIPERIVKGTTYEEHNYNVGELCHQVRSRNRL